MLRVSLVREDLPAAGHRAPSLRGHGANGRIGATLEVEPETLAEVADDHRAALTFSMRILRQALFAETTFPARVGVAERRLADAQDEQDDSLKMQS
jgi:hypothetical protein